MNGTEILASPLSHELLASGIPAQFTNTALDGDPQVVPIGVGRPWQIVDSSQAGDPDQRTNSVLQTLATDCPSTAAPC